MAAKSPVQNAKRSEYYYIRSAVSGLVLTGDEIHGSVRHSSMVRTFYKKDSGHGFSDDQLFYDDYGTGTIRIKVGKLCLDLEDRELVVKPYETGRWSQMWSRTAHHIRNIEAPDAVLELPGNHAKSIGVKVYANNFTGTENQKWSFELVEYNGSPPRSPQSPPRKVARSNRAQSPFEPTNPTNLQRHGMHPFQPSFRFQVQGPHPPSMDFQVRLPQRDMYSYSVELNMGAPVVQIPHPYSMIPQQPPIQQSEFNGMVLDMIPEDPQGIKAKAVVTHRQQNIFRTQAWFIDEYGIIRSAVNGFGLHTNEYSSPVTVMPFTGDPRFLWKFLTNKLVNVFNDVLTLVERRRASEAPPQPGAPPALMDVISHEYFTYPCQHWRLIEI